MAAPSAFKLDAFAGSAAWALSSKRAVSNTWRVALSSSSAFLRDSALVSLVRLRNRARARSSPRSIGQIACARRGHPRGRVWSRRSARRLGLDEDHASRVGNLLDAAHEPVEDGAADGVAEGIAEAAVEALDGLGEVELVRVHPPGRHGTWRSPWPCARGARPRQTQRAHLHAEERVLHALGGPCESGARTPSRRRALPSDERTGSSLTAPEGCSSALGARDRRLRRERLLDESLADPCATRRDARGRLSLASLDEENKKETAAKNLLRAKRHDDLVSRRRLFGSRPARALRAGHSAGRVSSSRHARIDRGRFHRPPPLPKRDPFLVFGQLRPPFRRRRRRSLVPSSSPTSPRASVRDVLSF